MFVRIFISRLRQNLMLECLHFSSTDEFMQDDE